MRQFTMNIDDGLLHAAKARALQTGRTVSGIVRDLLARGVGWSAPAGQTPPDDAAAAAVLTAYAEGRMTRRAAMASLGLQPDHYAGFADMMNRRKLAWPRPSQAQIDQEAAAVVAAISAARDAD